jgi:hypothetical protein
VIGEGGRPLLAGREVELEARSVVVLRRATSGAAVTAAGDDEAGKHP